MSDPVTAPGKLFSSGYFPEGEEFTDESKDKHSRPHLADS